MRMLLAMMKSPTPGCRQKREGIARKGDHVAGQAVQSETKTGHLLTCSLPSPHLSHCVHPRHLLLPQLAFTLCPSAIYATDPTSFSLSLTAT